MSNVVHNPVLSVNSMWRAINVTSVKDAIVAMTGDFNPDEPITKKNSPPAKAMDIVYDTGGSLVGMFPLAWEEWIKLPLRECDTAIRTGTRQIRVPTVIVQPNYSDMPMRGHRLTREAIFMRDGYVCQYSGEKCAPDDLNLDHVIPVCEGGKKTFENLVAAKKGINTRKGGRRPEAAGLKLIRKPFKPDPVPAEIVIANGRIHHKDWLIFLKKKKKP